MHILVYRFSAVITFIMLISACHNSTGGDAKSVQADSVLKSKPGLSKDSISVENQRQGASLVNYNDTIKLKYGFSVLTGNKEDLGKNWTYSNIMLVHKNKAVFKDSSDTEYDFDNGLYPIIIPDNEVTFEVLLEVNNRPNKNYLSYLKISNDRIIESRKMPLFFGKAARLGANKELYYAGIWDDREVWGTNEDTTDYCPILYYKITRNGIQLDSSLTVAKNTWIFGKFGGYDFDERIPVLRSLVEDRFEKEYDRIERMSK